MRRDGNRLNVMVQNSGTGMIRWIRRQEGKIGLAIPLGRTVNGKVVATTLSASEIDGWGRDR